MPGLKLSRNGWIRVAYSGTSYRITSGLFFSSSQLYRNLSHCFAIIIDAVIHLVTYAEVYIGIAIKELRCTFSRERNAVQETARGVRHVANWHSTVGLFPQGEGR